MRVAVPSARRAKRHRLKRIFTVAENTMGIKIDVYAHGDRTTLLDTTAADISAAGTPANGCVNDANGDGGRACNFSIAAPPGNDDFVAATYDKIPVSGSIPAGANQLGYGVANRTIVAGTAGSVNLTLSGVLAKIALNLTPNSLHLLIPSSATLSVYGLDADDDVIVANGFIDGSGNAVTVNLAANNTLPLVSGSPSPSLTLTTTSLTAPQPAGIAIKYAPQGNGIVSPVNETVTITATSSVTANATTTLNAVAPTFSSVADPLLNANNPYHSGMAFDAVTPGVDNVYYTSPQGFGSIDECANCAASPVVTNSAGTAIAPIRGGIVGNDASSYFPVASTVIYAVAGTVAETIGSGPGQTPIPAASAAPIPNGSGMAYQGGATPSIWYTSGTSLAQYFANGTPPNTNSIGVNTSGGVTIDTGANVWAIDTAGNAIIECASPCSGSTTAVSHALNTGGAPLDALAFGTNVFVTDHQAANPAIVEVNSGGAIAQTLPLANAAMPWYLMIDNGQAGIFWFDYLDAGGNIGLGRMDANNTPPTFLMATAPGSALSNCTPSSGAQAGVIATGPSGTVYMAFDKYSCLMRVTR